jgi:UDPglucose 6-dehydrogenase
MKLAVFGAGYVGLVTGACLADLGHDVVVRDIVESRIDALRSGEVPIHEHGLVELLERNRERLSFTTDVAEAIEGADVVFVAVGTPPTVSGDADLTAVWTVVDELPRADRRIVLAMKSTVPVGTGRAVRHRLDERGLENVGYVSNPEFTAEGTAVYDFTHPDRIVVGAFDPADAEVVVRLHAGIDAPVIACDVNSAEMIKLASNAFLVTRISFINEIANVCEATGADVLKVAEGIGLDHRLGPHFLRAGIGYGGSCLVGEETVLVRAGSGTRLTSLEELYEETEPGERVEILTWRPDGDGPEFLPVEVLTRRAYEGEIVEVRTKMGRRVRCTPDHPFVTQDGRKLAEELTPEDWLPIAVGAPEHSRTRARRLNVIGSFPSAGLTPDRVIVRPHPDELRAVGPREMQQATALVEHPRGAVARSHDILRSGAIRLHEAAELDLEIEDASFATTRNGTYVPATIDADRSFWRVVGLYVAEGHCTTDRDTNRRRLQWCFHPSDEMDLVGEVVRFWRDLGVKAAVFRRPTTTVVAVSSRILASWWLDELGLGSNCYEQRLPDLIWAEPEAHKQALLSGLWRGDGSWSFISGGPSVVLEYGTVSRELADGMLRLLADLGVVARLKVGRTAKSTVDTYWLVVSGADQVERCLDFVPEDHRSRIVASINRQQKRIAPTGYRRRDNAAWARVAKLTRGTFSGYVYSLEVPPTGTFVTTAGLVSHNCFPKDSLALKQLAANSGYSFQLLNAVIEVNELQKRRVVGKLERHLGSLRGKKIALLGLAFKPGTDDMREAPSLVLASRLEAEGAQVTAWDPIADGAAHLDGANIASSPLDALEDADAAVLVTEWPELAELDWGEVGKRMRNRLLVDGRNMLDPELLREHGFVYEGVGRPNKT